MSAAANRREQTLLGATVLTGLFAFLSQAGVPLGCSAQQIAMGKVPAGAGAGDLVSGLDLRAKSDHKHIDRGEPPKPSNGPPKPPSAVPTPTTLHPDDPAP